MRRRIFPVAVTVVVLSTFLLGFSAVAGEIKARMKERLPVITELKSQGLVGEDNQGFLRYLKGKKPHQAVVEAENRDRLAVYKIIAQRQNTSAALVGRQRAAQIASQAPSGTWVQDPGGAWRQVR
jgi:hypothetical protein